jgi:hypothetical protein
VSLRTIRSKKSWGAGGHRFESGAEDRVGLHGQIERAWKAGRSVAGEHACNRSMASNTNSSEAASGPDANLPVPLLIPTKCRRFIS